MKSLILPLILFFLLIFESVAVGLLPESVLALDILYIPHWILVFSILIVWFYDQAHTYNGILYGLIFGFLFELIYTDLLGVYLLAYGATLYVIHLLKKVLHQNVFVVFLVVLIGLIFAEFIIYGLYSIIGQITVPLNEYVQLRLIPTLLINLLFLLIIYPFIPKRLIKWQEEQQQIK